MKQQTNPTNQEPGRVAEVTILHISDTHGQHREMSQVLPGTVATRKKNGMVCLQIWTKGIDPKLNNT